MVYLLHFSQPFKHARHYIGFTDDLPTRLEAHHSGYGARLIEVIRAAGIDFVLARTWPGDRKTERSLKNQKHGPRLCPICAQPGRRERDRIDVNVNEIEAIPF